MHDLAKIIDHTALKPELQKEDIIQLCQEAKEYLFASVCVNPTWVSTAYELLKDTNVKVCTVIGFPLGAATPETKAFEAENAIENGATEVDMVINVGALKSRAFDLVEKDILTVVTAVKGRALIKVIFETSLLTNTEKKQACELSVKAGVDFVKTSTGFSNGGATIDDVALMRKVVGPEIGVKASGGIKGPTLARAMIDAGATRIGTSSGIAIVKGDMLPSDD